MPRPAAPAGVVAGVEGLLRLVERLQLFAPPLPRPAVAAFPSLSNEGILP